MIKNDITYEYRVFTNRLVDIDSMEVGRCTNSVLNKLKPKDKVNGRFYHTSDTDEWFFCWNGEMQKLNLKGDSDITAALEEVNKLISEANAAVSDAKSTANEAKNAAADAKDAAKSATEAVESIDNKADKTELDTKADKNVVEELVDIVNTKADVSIVQELSDTVAAIKLDDYALKSEVPSIDGYATESFVNDEIAKINIPTKVSDLQNDKNYLTEHQDISGKQDVIEDLQDIRDNASLGKTALQEVPAEYITETELGEKGYATESFVNGEIAKIKLPNKVSDLQNDKNYLTPQSLEGYALKSDLPSMDNYYTKDSIDEMIEGIRSLIIDATNITNTILG